MKSNLSKIILLVFLSLCGLTWIACGHQTVKEVSDVSLSQENPVSVEPLAATSADFSVSKAFSSNMVIQRDEPIRVWGWAASKRNGETVSVTFAGKTAEGQIENGEWTVTFGESFSANADLGNDMTVTCGADTVVFEDVLVGDVYMVIGQSNVAYSVQSHCDSHGISINTLAQADKPIRLYYNTLNDTAGYPARGTEEVCEDVVNGRGWRLPTAQNVRSFTAIGYLFALEIAEKTEENIPIGLIEIDGNGQPIGAFMSNEAAGESGSDTYMSGSGIYVPPGVNGTHARYMYNHYMYPYEQYALAGVIWYQGESDFDTATANTYVNKFVSLMEHMRSTHNLNNKDFPVYIVEIPTIYHKPSGYTGEWHVMDLGYIRAEMGSIPQRLSNSYLAVSSDIFTDNTYYNSLHPNIKDAQAKRLADIAGSVWYGLAPLDESTGPILKDYAISEDRKTVILTFDNVGDGLTTSDGGTTVNGFATFLKNGNLSKFTATATITAPDQITITSDKSMYGVAYNCVLDNFYGKQINLCNSHGMIASAFTFAEARMYQIRHELIGNGGTVLPLADGDVIAIHFSTTGNMTEIGTQLRRTNAESHALTLSLYAFDGDYETTLSASPIASKTFTDIIDCSWAELSAGRNSAWDPGEYLLVLSDPCGVSTYIGDTHEGQVLYRNGAYDEQSSLLLGITYDDKVDALYQLPTDPNRPLQSPDTETETETESSADSTSDPQDTSETETGTEIPSDTETEKVSGRGCTSILDGVLFLPVLLLFLPFICRRRKQE